MLRKTEARETLFHTEIVNFHKIVPTVALARRGIVALLHLCIFLTGEVSTLMKSEPFEHLPNILPRPKASFCNQTCFVLFLYIF